MGLPDLARTSNGTRLVLSTDLGHMLVFLCDGNVFKSQRIARRFFQLHHKFNQKKQVLPMAPQPILLHSTFFSLGERGCRSPDSGGPNSRLGHVQIFEYVSLYIYVCVYIVKASAEMCSSFSLWAYPILIPSAPNFDLLIVETLIAESSI